MIAMPLRILSNEFKIAALQSAQTSSLYIDHASMLAFMAGNENADWVYIWTVEADLEDADAINREFQAKLIQLTSELTR